MTFRDRLKQENIININKELNKTNKDSIYIEGNQNNRMILYKILSEVVDKTSLFVDMKNLKQFYYDVKVNKKKGLILMEHYSNFDFPILMYLLENSEEEWARELSKNIIAIAGIKLNDEESSIKMLADSFDHILVYPSRSLEKLSGEERKEEEAKAKIINLSSMRKMRECMKNNKVILVFPSGTRYRPGNPETKKGLKEIDSYLRIFDSMILISINGNCLQIDPKNPNDMLADLLVKDHIVFSLSNSIDCSKFRRDIIAKLSMDISIKEQKQLIVDSIMKKLETQHNIIDKISKVCNLITSTQLSDSKYLC